MDCESEIGDRVANAERAVPLGGTNGTILSGQGGKWKNACMCEARGETEDWRGAK